MDYASNVQYLWPVLCTVFMASRDEKYNVLLLIILLQWKNQHSNLLIIFHFYRHLNDIIFPPFFSFYKMILGY